MVAGPKIIRTFKWKDLHNKVLKIAVAEPDPEVLEFTGQVFAMDEKSNVWLLHEWLFKKEKKMIELGDYVEDTVTGFKGTVVNKSIWLNGCINYGVKPKMGKDGKVLESEWVDQDQLKILKKCAKRKKTNSGGPVPSRPRERG